MSHTKILAHQQAIHQFLCTLTLDVHFSKPVLNHMVSFIDGATQRGFSEDNCPKLGGQPGFVYHRVKAGMTLQEIKRLLNVA